MKKKHILPGMLGVLIAASAQASDKADFEACDGRIHPGKQDDGMRGAAEQSPYSSMFNDSSGGSSVGACTRALNSPRLLPTQTLRRAHLLRARAVGFLKAGDIGNAIIDLDQAEAATAGLTNDRFYQRSMAVSLKLLRALALVQSGDVEGAMPFARQAMEARPYSGRVQRAAATILQAGRPIGKASPSPWVQVSRLDPNIGIVLLVKEAEVGNYADVVALNALAPISWPDDAIMALATATHNAPNQLVAAMVVTLDLAYARAATGDAAGARADLERVRKQWSALRPATGTGQAESPANPRMAALDRSLEQRGRFVELRIAVTEGRPTEAMAALNGAAIPRNASAIEFFRALRAALPAREAALMPDVTALEKQLQEKREEDVDEVLALAMIAPETPRAVIDYERSRPNILGALVGAGLSMGTSLLQGVNRTDGFRATENPDGTIKVEFLGNTPSAPMVEEMTLLRAAEVVRSAGKAAFLVEGRNDYSRTLVATQYGRQVSSTPTGFKTELTIRPLDTADGHPRALNAEAVIDALGPLYYEEKKAKS